LPSPLKGGEPVLGPDPIGANFWLGKSVRF
jgi:hypothetical protein